MALSVLADPAYETLLSPAAQGLAKENWLRGAASWGTQGLALDCFLWRRLLLDEIHEAVRARDRS